MQQHRAHVRTICNTHLFPHSRSYTIWSQLCTSHKQHITIYENTGNCCRKRVYKNIHYCIWMKRMQGEHHTCLSSTGHHYQPFVRSAHLPPPSQLPINITTTTHCNQQGSIETNTSHDYQCHANHCQTNTSMSVHHTTLYRP